MNLTDMSPAIAPTTAHLANMDLAHQTMQAARLAGEGAPRLAVFYGPSGYGKTFAAAFVAAQFDAAYVLAQSVMTQRSFLEKLASELGIARPARTLASLMDQIIEVLGHSPRPIIIDEMDYLVKKQMVELIRDIHDGTDVAIMMIGEEGLLPKLKEWERFDNRIIAATPAQPSSIADGKLLRDIYCRHVSVADDLVEHFVAACAGVTRRIVVNLQRAQDVATVELETLMIDRAGWGKRAIVDGHYAVRRTVRA